MTRICTACKEPTPAENCVTGRSMCKPCHSLRCQWYYVKTAERFNARLAEKRNNDKWRKERAAYLRAHRLTPNPLLRERDKRHARAYQERYPEKVEARRIVKRAIKSGTLVRPSQCGRCGGDNNGRPIHAHHHQGYTNPLVVEWLCVGCHNAEHRNTQDRALITPIEGEK